MKTHVFKKNIFITAVLAALCACLLPQNSIAQTQPAPDDSAQSSASDTLPADILPSSPLAQVIKLAQAGVGESVMLTYINNSSSRFNLTSDQIIYLKDIGLPDDAVTAMMQRDQQLGAITVAQTPPPATETATVQPVFVTQNYFYDTLSLYGGWVEVEGYGRCWRPTVVIYDSSWQPYCNHGHWIYTDAGWYWVSDYSWGSCAFHYGRWFHDARFGWCWREPSSAPKAPWLWLPLSAPSSALPGPVAGQRVRRLQRWRPASAHHWLSRAGPLPTRYQR